MVSKTHVPGSHDFTVTDTELLLESPILGVRRDTVLMPGGATAKREVVEHFGAVAVVAFDGDNIAMVKQYRRSVGDHLWELPAGLLDIADEDELTGAQRELVEEAGLEAQTWSVLTDLITSPGFCDEAVRVFLAQDLKKVERPEVSGDEEADMINQWIPLKDAVGMVFSGELVNSIAIAGVMAADAVVAGRAQARPVNAPFAYRPTALAQRRKANGIVPDMKKL
ncbi:NTP pyrophosphohydrolase [Corynebacterium suranareeae]|uniref:NTP pyrophosphohydrolase n=1 Tax=Corynebacterium suranareeae TaxID=2506452 RepID=A0A160PQE9_9CORY|nr:NUDIX hydrolase [Corynebacterium suranareeae]BAU95774.1 NTP pyrophosphohydrolase [Corynebacterium suranareeae]